MYNWDSNLQVIFYNVEHGSCCHIITPNNKHILVDIGSKANKSVANYIKSEYFGMFSGVIDLLIVTHFHEDHIYDLPKLINNFQIKSYLRPFNDSYLDYQQNNFKYNNILDCLKMINRRYGHSINIIDSGLSNYIDFRDIGIDIEVVDPPYELTFTADPNSYSSIIILKYMGAKFVLTGDNPDDILNYMIKNNYKNISEKVRNATVLLAPHHGRDTCYSEIFLKKVNPILSIISDKNIDFNSQARSALLYGGRGTVINGENRYVLSTRKDGNIRFSVDVFGKIFVETNFGDY